MGEAKRGKSSFINALIGRDVLPTDVDVATSQVFRISRGSEAYRVRFEDDSVRNISAQELPDYGSQVVLDAVGEPWLDQTVRWIEVDVPARFLPDGVNILDTPGLGALYQAHAEVTYRFVPHADAVIFMLDSGQPIVQAELDLIKRILKVTPNLFFVQSKIDQFGSEHWEQVKARSEALLQEHFGEALTDVRIWPVSSSNLHKAATSKHPEALLKVSRYRALAEALAQFLQRMLGSARAAQALELARRYHATSQRVLSMRAESLEPRSQQELAEQEESLADRRAAFAAEWGGQGQKRAQLAHETKRIVAINKQAFRESLQPAGPVAAPIDLRINAVASLEQANALGEALSDELIAAALDQWRDVRDLTESRMTEMLAGFLGVADALTLPAAPDEPTISVSQRRVEKAALGALEGMTSVYATAMAPMGLSALLGVGLGPLGLVAGAVPRGPRVEAAHEAAPHGGEERATPALHRPGCTSFSSISSPWTWGLSASAWWTSTSAGPRRRCSPLSTPRRGAGSRRPKGARSACTRRRSSRRSSGPQRQAELASSWRGGSGLAAGSPS